MFARFNSLVFFTILLSYAVLVMRGGSALAQTEERDVPSIGALAPYHGVIPGTGNNLPRVEELKGKTGIWVTWPGFLLKEDGGSRIFLQTTQELTFNVEKRHATILLTFPGASVFLSNNLNPLVTEHFNTPLNRAYLKRKKKTVELVLELRVIVDPAMSQTVDQDGYHYLFIDFPSGTYPQKTSFEDNPSNL